MENNIIPFQFKLGPDAPLIIKRVLDRKGWVEVTSKNSNNTPIKDNNKPPTHKPTPLRTKSINDKTRNNNNKNIKNNSKDKNLNNNDNNNTWKLFWRLDRFLVSEIESCLPHQKLNHFPKSMEITRKDNLQRNLRKNKIIFGNIFEFFPESYSLPAEKKNLERAFKDNNHKGKNVWICKPRDLSRGRDIKVVREISQLEFHHSSVVQRYIDNPALLAGCLDPLTIYLYKDGFVRLSTKKYSMANVDDVYCHLTNTSINKENPQLGSDPNIITEDESFAESVTNLLGEGAPPKWKLTQLLQFLRTHERIDDVALWQKIQDILILSLLCLCSEKIAANVASSCFELFGFDENMKAWLLEVNFSPSMGCDCPPDFEVKESMISGLVDTLGFGSANSTPFPAGEGGFELIFPFNDKTKELAQSKQSMINIKGIVDEVKARQKPKLKLPKIK